ncbi:hypothetical protein K474DRAFT_750755 [Panus rudis PR-1116 ss-1]|nr:hypothetical protein K474DRAFT_750755 [Panus rudis PR-1116 ss-1]
MALTEGNVAVFWDYDNCPIATHSDGYVVSAGIRTIAHQFGALKVFKVYRNSVEHSQYWMTARLDLTSSGVDVIDNPHAENDSVEEIIMVDMLSFAIDNTPSTKAKTTIMVISGDGNHNSSFQRAFSLLRHRQYHLVYITRSKGGDVGLKRLVDQVLDWHVDVLNTEVPYGMAPSDMVNGSIPGPILSSTVDLASEWEGISSPSGPRFPSARTGPKSPPGLPTPITPVAVTVETSRADRSKPASLVYTGSTVFTPLSQTNNPNEGASSELSKRTVLSATGTQASASSSSRKYSEVLTVGTSPAPLYEPAPSRFVPTPTLASSTSNSQDHNNATNATGITAVGPVSNLAELFASSNPIITPSVIMYQTKKPSSKYKSLVKVLEAQRLQGYTRVSSSALGTLLRKECPDFLPKIGSIMGGGKNVKLREVTDAAAKDGVVINGQDVLGDNGSRWTALHPVYHGYGRKQPPPQVTTGTVQGSRPEASTSEAGSSLTVPMSMPAVASSTAESLSVGHTSPAPPNYSGWGFGVDSLNSFGWD